MGIPMTVSVLMQIPKVNLRLAKGTVFYTGCDAAQAIGAYAFAETTLVLRVESALPSGLQRRAWSYSIYDAQPITGKELNY